MQFERVISMMRYWPAKGTAGLARSRVRGKSRSPAPPASRTPSVSLIVQLPQAIHSRQTQISRAGTHESSMQRTENADRNRRAAGRTPHPPGLYEEEPELCSSVLIRSDFK